MVNRSMRYVSHLIPSFTTYEIGSRTVLRSNPDQESAESFNNSSSTRSENKIHNHNPQAERLELYPDHESTENLSSKDQNT